MVSFPLIYTTDPANGLQGRDSTSSGNRGVDMHLLVACFALPEGQWSPVLSEQFSQRPGMCAFYILSIMGRLLACRAPILSGRYAIVAYFWALSCFIAGPRMVLMKPTQGGGSSCHHVALSLGFSIFTLWVFDLCVCVHDSRHIVLFISDSPVPSTRLGSE